MSSSFIAAVLTVGLAFASPAELDRRTQCVACNPAGIKSSAPPAVGPGLSRFYDELVDSVKNIHFKRSAASGSSKSGDSPICCAQNTQCVLLNDFGIPFCYDKFTTNFFLPDGSSGNIHDGSYEPASGDKVNLINGKVEGTNVNIYANSQSDMPNTASMDIPAIYTASGVGSIIPQNSVGNGLSVTATAPTTIAAITVHPTTVAATTIDGAVIPEHTVSGTTISARTISKSAPSSVATGSASAATSSKSSKSSSPAASKSTSGASRSEIVSFIVMAPILLVASFMIFL